MNTPTTRRFDGNFLVWRVLDNGTLRQRVGHKHTPKYRHKTFDEAETEAHRLAGLHPGSSFVVLQEIATIKVREEAPLTAEVVE